MPEPATSDQVELEALLDELVPPPGPRWRRVVLWTAFVGLLAALVWATISGTIVAKVSTGVDSWGGAGPVSISTFVINDSRVDIVVTDGPRPRPGLTLLGYTTRPPTPDGLPAGSQTDPFPLRLQPGERADLTAWYRVTDCDAIAGIDDGDDGVDLQVRIADGPAAWITTERSIDAQDLSQGEPVSTSWPAAVAFHACPT